MHGTPVTMRDVAAVAGVSVSTVSRTLKGTGRISPQTRQRVLEVADRLDFHPNALAQNFATGRSLTVAVLTERALTTFSHPVIIGLTRELSAHDIATIFYDDEDDASTRPINLRKLKARRVDGVVVIGKHWDQPTPSIHHQVDVPVVHAFSVSDRPADLMVLPDDHEAGRVAARHFLELGRTKLAHVTGPAASLAVQERVAGFLAALADAGLEPVLPVAHGDWSKEWGLRASDQIDPREVDGIFCGNDFIGLGMARGLYRRGISVPDDVAIIGYDNWAMFATQHKFLTSIDPELLNLGRTAGRRLVEATTGTVRPGLERTGVTLIKGLSSGAVREDLVDVSIDF